MIELNNNTLTISFSEVHPDAKTQIEFQRTLRIPDDGEVYPLPPGLGKFPLYHVEDFVDTLPEDSVKRGGIIMPMYQSEALWIYFHGQYPIALKVGTGQINAISGEIWAKGLRRSNQVSDFGSNNNRGPNQDYIVTSEQPWLDGYCIEKGIIRQFVAMPLCSGATVEEQLTGNAQYGGLQIEAFPLKAEKWEAMQKIKKDARFDYLPSISFSMTDMGMSAGGRMKQDIYDDPFEMSDWDLSHSSRCWVHICNSESWQKVTGKTPPHTPPTAKDYNDAHMPWFDYYSESKAINGSEKLKGVKSVSEFTPDDPSFNPNSIHTINGIPIVE